MESIGPEKSIGRDRPAWYLGLIKVEGLKMFVVVSGRKGQTWIQNMVCWCWFYWWCWCWCWYVFCWCWYVWCVCFCCFELISYKYHLHKYPSLNRACYNQALRDMNISMNHIPCLQYVEARFSEEWHPNGGWFNLQSCSCHQHVWLPSRCWARIQ